MRMSRRIGLYVAKRMIPVSIYGAASETVTLTHSDGTVLKATTNSEGSAGTKELKFGSYTVKGSVSGYSRTVTVNKSTTMVGAFPDNTFFWHGYKGNVGGWTRSGYSEGHTNNGTVSVGTSLYVECTCYDSYNKYKGAVVGSANAISVNNLNKIVFRASSSDSYYARVGITQSKGSCTSNGKNVAVGSSGNYTIDVSGMTGNYYLFVSTWVYDWGNKNTTATRIYGE